MISLARSLNSLTMRLGRGAPDRLLWMVRHFPAPIMNALRMAALRRTVRLAGRRSRFYGEKFAKQGIDPDRVRRLEDLESVETTPEELRSAAPEDLLCGTPELVVESSGTTGRVTRAYLSHREMEYYARQGVILLAMIGVGSGDRILGAFDYSWGLGGIYTQRVGAHSGLFGAFPGLVEPGEAVDRLAQYGFTVVMGDPFWIARFTEIAMARNVRAPMTAFVSGAERITDSLRALIEDYWKAPLYMTYASTELGASLGAECRERKGYNLHEYDYAVEIFDPDSDGFGEVTFTTLTRTVMPLIRYRTRDIARLISEPCPCGLPFRRLSTIRARSYEVVACVWGDVHPELFEDLLRGVEGVADEWQVVLRQEGLRPVFEFRLESAGGEFVRSAADSRIRSRLAERHPPLAAKLNQHMCDIEVRLVPCGSLRKGRKIRRLVDKRDVAAWVGEEHMD
jgi:phenylacetate-CoA ligase